MRSEHKYPKSQDIMNARAVISAEALAFPQGQNELN